jgi:hypothetical protein
MKTNGQSYGDTCPGIWRPHVTFDGGIKQRKRGPWSVFIPFFTVFIPRRATNCGIRCIIACNAGLARERRWICRFRKLKRREDEKDSNDHDSPQ